MSTKPYSPVKKDETEAVAQDEKEAEDKEEEEKEEEKVENLDPQHQLYYFCRRADIDGIKEVQNKGIDVNARDDTGTKQNPYISHNTALHYAVISGSLETVKVIYNLEAKLDIKNKLGSTPLHVAAALGYTEIVKYLIEVKADIEAKNKIQNTPLHCAVYAGHVDTVEALLEASDDKRQSLLLPVNGIGFGAVKYTAHEDMKKYLRANYFPKENKGGDITKDQQAKPLNGNDVEEEEEEMQPPPPKYEGPNGTEKENPESNDNDNDNDNEDDNNDTTDDVQEDEADETTGLTTGTPATATEQ